MPPSPASASASRRVRRCSIRRPTPSPSWPNAPAATAAATALFEIPDDALVLAATPGSPLTVYAGTPEAATTTASGGMLQAGLGVGVMVLAAILLVIALGVRP